MRHRRPGLIRFGLLILLCTGLAAVVGPAYPPAALAGRMPVAATAGAAPSAPRSPVTGHPRLWLGAADLPGLRGWAVAGNPVYQDGLLAIATQAKADMDAGRVPGQDSGAITYVDYPSEMYAELFAFMALVSPDPATRDDYTQRAHTLLMYVMNRAVLGAAPGVPFRDPEFAINDRSRWHGEGFALTVDWIYPSLSAAEKATIRTVFLRWIDENLHAAVTGFDHPEPIGVVNDPILTSDLVRVRWAGNNYWTAHMRNIGLMALALDPGDDPGGTLHAYLGNATGAWLYVVDDLMCNASRGGLFPEGFEYGPQTIGYVAQFFLALHTAGEDDPTRWGPQVVLNNNPFWTTVLPAYLHSLSPVAAHSAYLNTQVYLPAWYGDGQNYWSPDFIAMLGPLGLFDGATGNPARQAAARWALINLGPGLAGGLTTRAADSNFFQNGILYFLLLDPTAAAPADPRPALPLTFDAPGLHRILARTSWDATATWFTYKLSWNSVDHQYGDGNQFEFYRGGEWLTKQRSGYDLDYGGPMNYNTLALENDPPAHNDNCDYRHINWLQGAQWGHNNPPDPLLVAQSFGAGFVYATGDATSLYNSPYEGSLDIAYANRSIVWLEPDEIVVYDRAASQTAGRFKRFWLNFPAAATVAGNRTTMTTAAGQHLFVTTLLPTDAAISVEHDPPTLDCNGQVVGDVAYDDPMQYRLKVEAPGGPATVRFLHVLQGADAAAAAEVVAPITSSSGTPFSGTLVHDTAILFPVTLSTTVSSLTYSVPAGTLRHLITGLVPNSGYIVLSRTVGSQVEITIQPGGSSLTDSGGVLSLGNSPPATPLSTPNPTPTGGPCTATFTDVHSSDYFATPVAYLACHGVISGYADGTFRPYNQTTRAQQVKIVVLGFNLAPATPPAGGQTFADVPPGFPFFSVIETAAQANLVSGYSCGGAGEPCDGQNRPYFRPYAWVTRGQLAKITVAAAGWALLTPPTGSFADVVPNTAFYPFVETAACHGIISGYACGSAREPCDGGNRPYFRQYNPATRGQIAKIVYLAVSGMARCLAPGAQP